MGIQNEASKGSPDPDPDATPLICRPQAHSVQDLLPSKFSRQESLTRIGSMDHPVGRSFALWDRHHCCGTLAFLELRTLIKMETNPFQPFCLIFCDCLSITCTADGDVLAVGRASSAYSSEGPPISTVSSGKHIHILWVQKVFLTGLCLAAYLCMGLFSQQCLQKRSGRVYKK